MTIRIGRVYRMMYGKQKISSLQLGERLIKWGVALIFYFSCSLAWAQSDTIVLVLDPGHGGKDPGNTASASKYLSEKDLNLKIALKIGEYCETYLDNVKVIYTRTDDVFLELKERAKIANTNNADYFISIHCNSSDYPSVQGTEVHILKPKYTTSYNLAKRMDQEFVDRARRNSRGIKTSDDRAHNLQVLKDTDMPAILIECGFMTNEDEERYLNTEYGVSILASAIYRAFRDFSGATKKAE